MSKWIDLETDASTGKPYLWKCDECGEEVETRWNYCPECGDPKTGKAKSINTLVKALETEHRKLKEMQSKLGTNLAEVGTDCISRQAAIDALEEGFKDATEGVDKLSPTYGLIKAVTGIYKCLIGKLPSAQPENRTEERTETHACDYISRQQAIDEIDEWIKAFRENGHKESAADACLIQDGIIQLPPAHPEQNLDEWCTDCKEYDKEKHSCPRWNRVIRQALADAQPRCTGKWIPSDSQCGIRCSACGAPVDDFCHSIDYIDLVYEPNFCPNCGAKMMEGAAE